MDSKNSKTSMAATTEVSNLSVTTKELTMNSIAIADRTINVPFHGANLFLVSNGTEPFVPMKPIVEGMGLTWQSQHEKLKQRFSKGITEIVMPSAGGKQAMTCLAFRKFAAWLASIQPNKVKPEIRERVIQYQEECDDVLYEYWIKGEVVNPRKENRTLPGKITIEQQEAIKQLVLTRGKALPKERQAKAMITMWSALKSHFGATYKKIDSDQFTEALSLAARIPLEGEFIGRERLDLDSMSSALVHAKKLNDNLKIVMDLWQNHVLPLNPPILVSGTFMDSLHRSAVVVEYIERVEQGMGKHFPEATMNIS